MKKAAPVKKTVKMSSTNQIILAAILVLLIFLAAMLSSPAKKDQVQKAAPQTTAVNGETRTGTQVARISIVRNGESGQGATIGTTGFVNLQPPDTSGGTSADSTGNLEIEPAGTQTSASAATSASEFKSGGAIPAGERVQFKIDTFKKLAVQPLKFKVFDALGMELTPDYLQTVREHKMHLTLVSANLREFQHLFPDYANGQWNASAYMPSPGTYLSYISISPVKGNPEVLRSDLTVREATKGTVNYPGLTPNLLAITDGASAVLGIKGIGLGAENIMAYSLTRDGKNLESVSPYTGAFGSVTVFRQGDPNVYISGRGLPVTDESKGMFDFAAQFDKAGRYTAFAEFKADGRVLVFPITFDMP